MDFFIDKFKICFGINESFAEKFYQDQIKETPETHEPETHEPETHEPETPEPETPEPETPEPKIARVSLENLNLGEIPDDNVFFEYTSFEDYENTFDILRGFFYTLTFIMILSTFDIQRKFLLAYIFK